MSKKQTRRSISLRAEVFVRLKRLANLVEKADAAAVEDAINEKCDRLGVAAVSREEAIAELDGRKPKADGRPPPHDGSGIFTF